MKVGDNVPVTIAGQAVAMATVKEMGEGQAVLIVPATRVVMAVRTELAYEAPVVQEQTTETIVTGVDRAEGAGEVAAVVENVNTGAAANVDGATVETVETVEPAANTVETSTAVESPVESNDAPSTDQ